MITVATELAESDEVALSLPESNEVRLALLLLNILVRIS